jgi:hypothetical protein
MDNSEAIGALARLCTDLTREQQALLKRLQEIRATYANAIKGIDNLIASQDR